MIHIKQTRFALPDTRRIARKVIALKAAHRRQPAGCAAASPPGQRLPDPPSVVGLLPLPLADPVLPGPGELDVAPSDAELPEDDLSDPVPPDPELPDVEAGVLPPMFRHGM